MPKTGVTKAKGATTVNQAKKAAKLRAELVKVLGALGKASGLSDSTKGALANAGWQLGNDKLPEVLERALDELNAVPSNRVDTDRLKVGHATILCFDIWADEIGKKTKIVSEGRTTGDDLKLLRRFMKNHKDVEISTYRVPFGGSQERFEVSGTKAARLAFENDPAWPKLQKALEDIYWTDHSAGYSDDIAKRKRKIKDPMTYVFGGQ